MKEWPLYIRGEIAVPSSPPPPRQYHFNYNCRIIPTYIYGVPTVMYMYTSQEYYRYQVPTCWHAH